MNSRAIKGRLALISAWVFISILAGYISFLLLRREETPVVSAREAMLRAVAAVAGNSNYANDSELQWVTGIADQTARIARCDAVEIRDVRRPGFSAMIKDAQDTADLVMCFSTLGVYGVETASFSDPGIILRFTDSKRAGEFVELALSARLGLLIPWGSSEGEGKQCTMSMQTAVIEWLPEVLGRAGVAY